MMMRVVLDTNIFISGIFWEGNYCSQIIDSWRAGKITPDPKDTEYIALALKIKCSVWSNDKQLKEQDKVEVYNTSELLKCI